MPQEPTLSLTQRLAERRRLQEERRKLVLSRLRERRGVPEEGERERSRIENFIRGGAAGVGQSLTSLTGLPGLLIPGDDPFERFSTLAGEKVEAFFDPQGKAGKAGRVTGRILGEGVQALTGGALIAKGIGAAARAGRGGKALKGFEAARVGRRGLPAKALARNVPFVPVDFAIGAARGQREGVDPITQGLKEVALGQVAGNVFDFTTSAVGVAASAAAEELAKRSEGFASLAPALGAVRRRALKGPLPLGALAEEQGKAKRIGFTRSFVTLLRAGFLNNPKTQVVNITGNTLFGSLELARQNPTAVWDMILSAGITGERTRARLDLGQVLGTLRTTLRGGKVKALRGTPFEGRNRSVRETITGPVRGASPKGNLFKAFEENGTTGHWLLDIYANVHFKALGAGDALFRGGALEGSLRNQLRVRAIKEGISRKQIPAFIEKKMRTLDLELPWLAEAMDVAENDALQRVFQDKNFFSRTLNDAVEKAPALGAIFPFITTPAAIAQRVLEYSPIGFLMAIPKVSRAGGFAKKLSGGLKGAEGKAFFKKILKKKKGRKFFAEMLDNQRKAVDILGRATTGSFGLIGLGLVLASHKLATGELAEPGTRERQVQDAAGMQAFSVRLPDGNWHRIGNLAPAGNLIAMGAEIHRIVFEGSEQGRIRLSEPRTMWNMVAATATTGIAALADQPFFTGMREMVAFFTNPMDNASKSGEDLLASFVPAGVAAMARSLDNSIREDDGLAQSFIARLPILSRVLPQRLNAFGEPIERIPGVWANLIDPTTPRKATDNPIIRELARVKAGVPRVQRRREPDGTPEDLVVFQQRQRWFGQFALNAAWEMMNSEVYGRADDIALRVKAQFELLKEKGIPEELISESLGGSEAKLIDDWARGIFDGDTIRRWLLEWGVDTARRQVAEFID